MSKERSEILNEEGRLVGVNYTEHHDNGSSTTTHRPAEATVFGDHEGGPTSVTENKSDGTSKDYRR